eukprot:6483598-Amphidinium_carterae.1
MDSASYFDDSCFVTSLGEVLLLNIVSGGSSPVRPLLPQGSARVNTWDLGVYACRRTQAEQRDSQHVATEVKQCRCTLEKDCPKKKRGMTI